MALNDKIMFMEEIKWIDDPAVTTDDLPLMDKDSAIRLSGNSKKIKKIASNLDVDRVQIYRSCTYWKVNPHRDSVQSRKNWKPIEYVDFVKDFEGSLLSGKEMTKKYTARWERLSVVCSVFIGLPTERNDRKIDAGKRRKTGTRHMIKR